MWSFRIRLTLGFFFAITIGGAAHLRGAPSNRLVCESIVRGDVDPSAERELGHKKIQESAASMALESLFRRTYGSNLYECNYCGRNVTGFVRLALQQGIEVGGARVLRLSSTDYYVHAFEARGLRERDWEFHVVLEHRGKIYDFDFGSKPAVVDAKEYFERMFKSDPRIRVEATPIERHLAKLSGKPVPVLPVPRETLAEFIGRLVEW